MDRSDAIVRAAVAWCVVTVGVPAALGVSVTIAPFGDPTSFSSYNSLWIVAVLVIGLGTAAGWIGRGWPGYVAALLGIPAAVALVASMTYVDSWAVLLAPGIVLAVLITTGYAIGRAVRRQRTLSRERPSPSQTGVPPEAYGGGTREGRGDDGAGVARPPGRTGSNRSAEPRSRRGRGAGGAGWPGLLWVGLGARCFGRRRCGRVRPGPSASP